MRDDEFVLYNVNVLAEVTDRAVERLCIEFSRNHDKLAVTIAPLLYNASHYPRDHLVIIEHPHLYA